MIVHYIIKIYRLFGQLCLTVKKTKQQQHKKNNEFLYKMGPIITIEELAFCIVFILGLSLNLHSFILYSSMQTLFYRFKQKAS